jgi:enoyl-[acyl-carrier protein] reductase I
MIDFLGLSGTTLLVFGVANKKSVAYHDGKTLEEAGAKVVYVVRSEERRQSVAKILPAAEVHICDVEFED